jgi:hypothetical protein
MNFLIDGMIMNAKLEAVVACLKVVSLAEHTGENRKMTATKAWHLSEIKTGDVPNTTQECQHLHRHLVILDGIMVTVLVIGAKVRGFKPGQGRRIFKSYKIRNTPSFGGGSKAVCPMS